MDDSSDSRGGPISRDLVVAVATDHSDARHQSDCQQVFIEFSGNYFLEYVPTNKDEVNLIMSYFSLLMLVYH